MVTRGGWAFLASLLGLVACAGTPDSRVDAGPGFEACGDHHIRYRFAFPGEPDIEGCAELRDGIQVEYFTCAVGDEAYGDADDLSQGLSLQVGVAANFTEPGIVENPGTVPPGPSTIRLFGTTTDGTICQADQPACVFNYNEGPGCRFEITRPGSIGELGEARLAEACTLPFANYEVGDRQPTFHALVMRGELTANLPPPDAGLPCSE